MPSPRHSLNSSDSPKTLAILLALGNAIVREAQRIACTDSDSLVISNYSKMAAICGTPKITVTWDSGG